MEVYLLEVIYTLLINDNVFISTQSASLLQLCDERHKYAFKLINCIKINLIIITNKNILLQVLE